MMEAQKRLGMWLDGLMPEDEQDSYRTSGQKHDDELAVMAALIEAQKEVAKWKRIRTPTHGPCCTCQACGLDYDECRCSLDDVVDENERLRKELAEMKERWQAMSDQDDEEYMRLFQLAKKSLAAIDSLLSVHFSNDYTTEQEHEVTTAAREVADELRKETAGATG